MHLKPILPFLCIVFSLTASESEYQPVHPYFRVESLSGRAYIQALATYRRSLPMVKSVLKEALDDEIECSSGSDPECVAFIGKKFTGTLAIGADAFMARVSLFLGIIPLTAHPKPRFPLYELTPPPPSTSTLWFPSTTPEGECSETSARVIAQNLNQAKAAGWNNMHSLFKDYTQLVYAYAQTRLLTTNITPYIKTFFQGIVQSIYWSYDVPERTLFKKCLIHMLYLAELKTTQPVRVCKECSTYEVSNDTWWGDYLEGKLYLAPLHDEKRYSTLLDRWEKECTPPKNT